MPELFETRMGQRFFESTMPAIARELARLNGLLERAVKAFEREARRGSEEFLLEVLDGLDPQARERIRRYLEARRNARTGTKRNRQEPRTRR
jgi:hypothetical protein